MWVGDDSIVYQMLRKEDLYFNEEQSYQRQINKQKIQIRRRDREATFNCKRNNFIPTHFLSLQRINSKDRQQKEQTNEASSREYCKIVDKSIYILDQRYIEQIIQANQHHFPKDIQVYSQLINSHITLGLIYGTIGLRKLLTNTENIQVHPLIELMTYRQSKQVQFEATWCIANIAAGTTQQCKILMDGGVVRILLDFLNQNNSGIVEQAVWALGNLSVDCSQFRNILLEAGVGEALSTLAIKEDIGEQFRIECCWTLANLCRGDPIPDFDHVKNSLRVICSMVSMGCITSTEIFTECCWALSYHYTGKNDRGRDALDFNLLQRIVPFGLQTERTSLVLPIIRILGGLSQGNKDYTEYIIKKGGLDLLQKCIQHNQKMIRREAAYILSNLTATVELPQIQHILGRDTIMIKMTEMFVNDQEDVRREIAYFFSNMCYGGKNLDLVKVFAELEITTCYVELLKSDNHKAIKEGLQSLNHILRFAQNNKSSYSLNILAEQLIHNGGVQIIEALQYNNDDDIYIRAHSIIVSYFSIYDPLGPLEDVDETIDESTYSDQPQWQQGQIL